MNVSPKRVNFINIQQSHVVAAKGYRALPLRTGYESVLAHRTDDLFSFAVRKPGTLTTVTPDHIVITYDDPELPQDRVEIGRRYGLVTGTTVPHDIVCDIPEGTKLAAGTVVAFNTGFYERDLIDPMQVVWKGGILARTVLMDTPDTLEDSSAVSPRIAKAMEINTTELREIKVRFTDEVRNLVNLGEEVTNRSVLCTIEDSITSTSDLFDDAASDQLRLLARNNPKAKYDGRVGDIEIIYNGDPDDMTESLRAVVMAADTRRARRVRRLRNGDATTGEVMDLDLDTVLIRIRINSTLTAGDGDKGVFANQLKTVIRRVVEGRFETKSGLPLDAIFGYTSVLARIVHSPSLMGTANVLLRLFSERFAANYRKPE